MLVKYYLFSFCFFIPSFVFIFNVKIAAFPISTFSKENLQTEENILLEAEEKAEHEIKQLLGSGELFEGDMIAFDESLVEKIKNPKLHYKSAKSEPAYKWPNAVVPFVMNRKIPYKVRSLILDAMEEIENQSCVRFVRDEWRETPNVKPLQIMSAENKSICASTIGRQPQKNQTNWMVLHTEGCHSKGLIVHELFHVLGFCHEQCREDRDNFVDIHYENIALHKERNFQKFTFPFRVYTPYDYGSIMHYAATSFAEDGIKATIVPKRQAQIGQRDKLSRFDVMKINRHYQCGETDVRCKDSLSIEECHKQGLGALNATFMDPDQANCRFEDWAVENCIKTCGECYRFVVEELY